MPTEPALQPSSGIRTVVTVTFDGRDGIAEREVSAADFEPTERGVTMGSLLVPWTRVFRYDLRTRQPFVPDAEDGGSRATQRVVYEDEHGTRRAIEVPYDRFEGGPWALTVVTEREVDAARGELFIRKTTIPWHRVVETERIFAVPEASAGPN